MRSLHTLALLSALSLAAGASAQVVFSEDFDDGAASTRWSAPIVDAENGVFDGQVDYAFDYGAVGIPAAPGSTSTTGVLFEVNTTDQGGDQGEAVAIAPSGFDLPEGSYRFSAQAYFNVEAQNGGSTEFGLLGVHTAAFNAPADQGLNDDLPFDFGISNGNGLGYMASGDSGAFNDFHRFEDAGNLDTGSQTGLGSYDAQADAGEVFDTITNPVDDGPRGLWIELAVERVGSTVSFIVDGVVVDTILNGNDYSDGSVFIGYADYFNSVAPKTFLVGPDPTPFDDSDGPFGDDIPGFAHFLILDNVTVESIVPEPSSAAIALLAMSGLLASRRR